ncbi:MAG: AAA family ATPase [Thermoleophilia bacterium]|nr:AAA family ATPase [Thermoleophilia bacterium]
MNTATTEPQTGRPARPSLLQEQTPADWDYAAEQATLGGVLLIPTLVGEVRSILTPSDFYLPCHQRVFATILELADEDCPIDPITVKDRLGSDPEVMAEETNYIFSLPALSVPALHAPYHARIVKDLALRRRAKGIAWALMEGRLTSAEAQAQLMEVCSTEAAQGLPTVAAVDFCREVPEEPDWILQGYVARGAITELDAKIKTGKTTFACDLVRAVLGGEEFIGRKTTPTPVLYLTEERESTFRAALGRVGLGETDGLHLGFKHKMKFPWKDMGRLVVARAKSLGIGLVVIDTLSDWSGLKADEENDAGAALEAMRPLQEMAAAGLAVLVLRHERKSGGDVGDSARGSSAFGGAADILLSLRRHPAGEKENRRILEAVGRLEGWAPKLIIEMRGGHYHSLGTNAQVEHQRAREMLLELLPEDVDNAVTEKDLLALAPEATARSTLKRALTELVSEGLAARQKGAGSAPRRAFGFWKTRAEP